MYVISLCWTIREAFIQYIFVCPIVYAIKCLLIMRLVKIGCGQPNTSDILVLVSLHLALDTYWWMVLYYL